MCGRTAFTFKWRQLYALLTGSTDGVVMPEEFVRAWQVPDPAPRYNFKPSERGPVLKRSRAGSIVPATMTWGFGANGASCARSESVGEVRLWRRAANSHRCIVPVSGYYEWQRTIDGKQPWYFQRPGGAVMGLAGIWEPGPAPHHFDTYAVLTIAPNDAVKHIHDRMPLILPGSAWHDWMGASPLEKVAHLMVIPPSETLTMHRVSRMVGNAASEGPELIRPLTSPPPPGGLFGQP